MDVSHTEMLLRLGMAMALGMALGLDRELRGRAAGLRTHGLVALSAAVITLSALMLRHELGDQALDPLRVVQGLAAAIGFIAAGTIIVTRGNVRGLTSAASIWLAAGLGITAGAGQFWLSAMAFGLGLVLLSFVRLFERFVLGTRDEKQDPQ